MAKVVYSSVLSDRINVIKQGWLSLRYALNMPCQSFGIANCLGKPWQMPYYTILYQLRCKGNHDYLCLLQNNNYGNIR